MTENIIENNFITEIAAGVPATSISSMINSLPCGIIHYLYDEAFTITCMNEEFLQLVGYTRKEMSDLFDNQLSKLIHPEDYEKMLLEISFQLLQSDTREVEYRIKTKDNSYIWVMDNGRIVNNAGIDFFASVLINITSYKQKMIALLERAERDSLTGLYNRMSAQILIEDYLKLIDDEYCAFMVMDIDDFKKVNDTYGHLFADIVLADIGALLRKVFRATDIVCRVGGDEMIIFMKDLPHPLYAEEKTRELLQAISDLSMSKLGNNEISCSIGVSIYPNDGKSFTALYRKADLALYSAKENGKDKTVLYSCIDGVIK